MILSFKKQFKEKIVSGTKIHTIREDSTDRWNASRKIHFATGVRTKHYELIKSGHCISTQKIEIEYVGNVPVVIIDNNHFFNPLIDKDRGMLQLAQNDGFASVKDFFEWFKSDFEGKIIHWTEKKY